MIIIKFFLCFRKNQRIYSYNVFKKILCGRKKIIDDLNGYTNTNMTNNIGGSHSFTMHQQVKRRYFRELSDIKHLVGDDSEDSSDSNYQGLKLLHFLFINL